MPQQSVQPLQPEYPQPVVPVPSQPFAHIHLQPTVSESPQLELFPSTPQQPFVPSYQVSPSQPLVSTVATNFSQPFPTNKELFLHQDLPNQFKPISPPPPSLNVLSQIPQPLPTIPSQPVNNFLPHIKAPTLLSLSSSQYQSPVMDAIPASEVLQNNNLSSTNTFTATNNSENNVSLLYVIKI